MKILIDCTNLQVGGGIQVATSFISDLNSLDSHDTFYIVLSVQMEAWYEGKEFKKNIIFIHITDRIQRCILRRVKFLRKIEREIVPDTVFCVFGPSYYKSLVGKTVGFAIPHYIYKDSPFFDTINIKWKLRFFLMEKIQIWLFKENSDKLIFETNDARKRFLKHVSFKKENTFVVNNTLNAVFSDKSIRTGIILDKNSSLNILCIGAYYKHKNIEIIPYVIDHLLDMNFCDFKFYVTVESRELIVDEKYKEYICFLGKIRISDVPSLYEQTDILFMPTLLEVFSTTYLEAMHMGIPIVTTNLSFARDICANGALYYDALDSRAAAVCILELLRNEGLKREIVKNAFINERRFPSSIQRTMHYLEIVKS